MHASGVADDAFAVEGVDGYAFDHLDGVIVRVGIVEIDASASTVHPVNIGA